MRSAFALAPPTSAASDTTADALWCILDELRALRSQVSTLERSSSNSEQRLEIIEQLLRRRRNERQEQQPQQHQPTPRSWELHQRAIVALVCAVALVVHSRRMKTLLVRIPFTSLLLLQIFSGATLAAFRSLDVVNTALTGSDASDIQKLRRRLAYALLLGSAVAVPAKGVAHCTLRAK